MISLTDNFFFQRSFFQPSANRQLLKRIADFESAGKRKWGRMSPAQTLQHLDKTIGCGVGLYQFPDISKPVTRTLLKWVVIYLIPRFPRNARTGTMLTVNDEPDFSVVKQNLLNTLELAFKSTQNAYPHPLFGKMSRFQWGILVYKHLDHHLRQFGL